MTDEAAESRRPATTEGADAAQPPLPGEAPPVRAHTLPAHQPATAAPGVDQNPDDQPTAEVPVPPAAEAPPPPISTPAWVAGAASGPGGMPAGSTPPPFSGYGGPAKPPPPADAGFTSRYGLVRPRQGRYLAGVCAAIGRATNTDPVLWRVLLAILGFFGGIGILVYVAAWLIIPAEGDSASPVESMLGRGRSSMSPVTVIILGVLVAVMFGFIVTDQFRSILLGAAILIGGALLLNRNSAGVNAAPGTPVPGGAPAGSAPPAGGWSPGPTPPAGSPSTAPAPGGTWPADPTTQRSAPMTAQPTFSGPVPPVSPSAAPAEPGYPMAPPRPADPGPPAPWPAPDPVTAIPATSSAPPAPYGALPPGGYRPPFAPRGPYAAAGPYPPTPAPPPPPKPPKERSPLGAATFSMIFVAIGAVAVLDLSDTVPIGPSAYFAAALVTIALGLLVGAWFGRARWLIALGLAATAALGTSTLAESFDDKYTGSGIVWTPRNYDELATHYESNFGNTTLDLTGVDFTDRNAQVTIKVAFGELTVIVPPSVDVIVKANISAGDANVFDHYWGGVDMPSHTVSDLDDDGPGGGNLQLDLDVVGGNVEVRR